MGDEKHCLLLTELFDAAEEYLFGYSWINGLQDIIKEEYVGFWVDGPSYC